MFRRKRKEALQALGEMTAIAADYICEESDIKRFNKDIAAIAAYLKDPSVVKVLDIAKQLYSDRHSANNSSPIVGGEEND